MNNPWDLGRKLSEQFCEDVVTWNFVALQPPSQRGIALNCLLEQATLNALQSSRNSHHSDVLWSFKAYAYPIMLGFLDGGNYLANPLFVFPSAVYRVGSYLAGSFGFSRNDTLAGADVVFIEQARRYARTLLLSGRQSFAPIDFANIYNILREWDNIKYCRVLKYNYLSSSTLRALSSASKSRPCVSVFWSYCNGFDPSGADRLFLIGKHLVSILRQRGVPAPVLRSLLWAYVLRFLPEVVISSCAWKGLLSTRNSGVIMLTGETAPIEYSGVVLASRFSNVPMLALQHGIIHPSHYGYFHTPASFEERDIPIPQLTMLAGTHSYEILRSFGYPRKRLVVTGAPRYDSLAVASEFFSRDKIRRRYRLPEDALVVLWTTQTHGLSNSENYANVRMIRDALRKLGTRVFLVIKLHPFEDQRAQLYRAAFSGFDNVRILSGNVDLYEIMYASDAVMLKNSTTGIEAIALGKPILLTDPLRQGAAEFYTSYGFNWVVHTSDDFVYYAEMLQAGTVGDVFVAARRRFMQDHVANFGHATERVVSILNRYLG